MSYRCEDYPCCGCGPEGCIDFSRTVSCEDCGKRYHPDQMTEVYCYACLATPRYVPWKRDPAKPGEDCCWCSREEEETPKATCRIGGFPYCDDCATETEIDNREAFEQEVREGRYDDRY
jgi:hypothetical protein